MEINMSAKVISLVNLKGGVGKTTLAVAIGEALACMIRYFRVGNEWLTIGEKRVLMIDLDGQSNLTFATMSEQRIQQSWDNERTTYHFFRNSNSNPIPLSDCIVEHASNIANIRGRLDVVPSSFQLFNYEEQLLEFANTNHNVDIPSIRNILRLALEQEGIKERYDYIIIDCPPNLSILTSNALIASDVFLVPVIPEYLSLRGLNLITSRFNEFRDHPDLYPSINNLRFGGCILNRVDVRRSDHLNKSEDILNDSGYNTFRNWIGDWKPMYVATDFEIGQFNHFSRKYQGRKQRPVRSNLLYNSGGGFIDYYIDISSRLESLAEEVKNRV
jgi:chromosome partitioning protein